MRTIELRIEPITVTAKCKRLQDARVVKRWRRKKFVMRIPWTLEPPQDLKMMHGWGVEREILDALTLDFQDLKYEGVIK